MRPTIMYDIDAAAAAAAVGDGEDPYFRVTWNSNVDSLMCFVRTSKMDL